ncbi:multidrug effflux MFS transporter [Flavisolibacter ginsenosidimutans]|uniref:Multidrug effflux MFS transporter n=1 Tax=Flavisolibacter ginsenosidimutans TaxID=661481 RepID=A0A5B8UFV2_9BACT|nr:multidrug effflux MFS transporter [Flavisolibacter ginsenosidimutans]QEC55464.1 multidrug effflux MFS transporter [Flavisolibacter ginsenosidimutans]
MNTNGTNKNFYLILILGLLTAIGPFSIDMYLPAFPDIAKNLHTSIAQVMLSLSSFFIGISVGQLIYGPLLERLGRKKPLYAGLCIYLLASVGCALATSVNSLILFRLLQALGGCAGMVAARAIVRDLFDVKQNAKIFSTLMLVVAVSPIIAPTAGGYVTAVFGWRYVFVILIGINIAILTGVYFLLPESKNPDPNFSLKAGAIVKNFAGIVKHPQFYTYAFTGAVAYGGLCAYISGSPNVFMEIFKVSEKQYGWIFALIALGIISASQINNLALKKYSSEQIIQISLLCQSAVGLTFACLALFSLNGLYITILLIFLFLCCQGFVFPNASALSLASFGHNAGSASALMGAIQMGVGAGASAVVSLLQNHTSLPMAGVMAGCSVSALLLYTLGRKLIVQQASKEAVAEEDVEMMTTL